MQPKLTAKIVTEIARYRRAGLSWKRIAKAIGVSRQTLHNWRKQSKTATKGNLKKLRKAIQAAELDIILASTQTVFEAATETRITKTVEKETDTGTETTVTEEGPNVQIALKVLERLQPERWAQKHNETTRDPNTSSNRESSAEDSGADPDREAIALEEDDAESNI